jgi:hypothetical protein
MLDDEEHLVVMLRLGERALLREQTVERQIPGVAEAIREVADDGGFDGALIVVCHVGLHIAFQVHREW